MFKRITVLFIIIVLQTTLAIYTGGVVLSGRFTEVIVPGVYSAGVDLGGLSRETALEALRERFSRQEKDSIILEGDGRQWIIPMESIGARYDYRQAVAEAFAVGHSGSILRRISELLGRKVEQANIPLPLLIDQMSLQTELKRINDEYFKKPMNARLVQGDSQIDLIPASDGREMDLADVLCRISDLKAGDSLKISFTPKTVAPTIKDGDLSGLTDVLGQYVTWFDADEENRSRGIYRSTGLLDGTLARPGETFSFNNKMEDARQSHQKAPVNMNVQLIDDYRGGIGQVASTLYGAVLLSGLQIVERFPHSRPADYVPAGLDAAVIPGEKDLRFRNNLRNTVYIISAAESGESHVKITILGKKEGKETYKIDTEEIETSPETVIKSSPDLEDGEYTVISEGSPGFKVSVYRNTVLNGVKQQKKELVSNDFSPPMPRVVLVGE